MDDFIRKFILRLVRLISNGCAIWLPVMVDMFVLSDDKTVPRSVAPFRREPFNIYDNYIPVFPKQHCLTTILYTLALHPLLTRTTEMDEVGCSLGIVGCVRSTEYTLWDLGSKEIKFVL